MRFHPAVQILTWSMLVALLQALTSGKLLAISGFILAAAISISRHKFILLLRRTRWVLFSLLLIYAFTTPGWALFESLGIFSPTREGLVDGAMQLTRLLSALAALAVLLERLHRQQLIAGLYVLFVPLQMLGLSRERLAVRLALTLHYAEITMLKSGGNWRATLNNLLEPHDEPMKHLELTLYRLGLVDAVLLLTTVLSVWLMLRWG